MKAFNVLLFLSLSVISAVSQTAYVTMDGGKITWASASYLGPNWGFYGQEITLGEDAEVFSVSVYIYDHKDHDETKSTVNFAVWNYDEKPALEIYLSEAQAIKKDQVGAWMEYEFPAPLSLKAGTYLFAVGQPSIQGFVAFGSQNRKAGYKGKKWIKLPLPGRFDGKEWITIRDLVKALGQSASDGAPDMEALDNNVLMMKIKLSK